MCENSNMEVAWGFRTQTEEPLTFKTPQRRYQTSQQWTTGTFLDDLDIKSLSHVTSCPPDIFQDELDPVGLLELKDRDFLKEMYPSEVVRAYLMPTLSKSLMGTYQKTFDDTRFPDVCGVLQRPFYLSELGIKESGLGFIKRHCPYSINESRGGCRAATKLEDKTVELTNDDIHNLDELIRISPDSPGTQSLESSVRYFVDWLLGRYFQLGNFPHPYSIKPIGSFPCDTKVCTLDEFDYLCAIDFPLDFWKTFPNLMGKFDNRPECRIFEETFLPYWPYFSIYEYLTTNPCGKDTVYISDISEHGPATCVKIRWTCPHGHDHGLSFDVTMSSRVEDDLLDANVKNVFKVLCGKYGGKYRGEEGLFLAHGRNYWTLSSTVYDKALFLDIKQYISEDAVKIFRCFKTIMKYLMPKRIKDIDRSLKDHAELSDMMDSHSLKCVWLDAIYYDSPDPSKWTSDKCLHRMVDLIKRVTQRLSCDDGKNQFYHKATGILGTNMFCNFPKDLLLEPSAKMDMECFCETLTKGKLSFTQSEYEEEDLYLLKSSTGFLHRITKEQIKYADIKSAPNSFDGICCYVVNRPSKEEPYLYHPLIRWCRSRVYELYSRHRGADLRSVAVQDFHHVWGLVYGGVLTEADIITGRYKLIVYKLRHYMVKCPRLKYSFTNGFRYKPMPENIRVYLKSIDTDTLLYHLDNRFCTEIFNVYYSVSFPQIWRNNHLNDFLNPHDRTGIDTEAHKSIVNSEILAILLNR